MRKQPAKAETTQPTAPELGKIKSGSDWIVERILLTAEAKKYGEANVFYPYHVIGHFSPACGGELFSWTLPREFWNNPRYDLSTVTQDERGEKP